MCFALLNPAFLPSSIALACVPGRALRRLQRPGSCTKSSGTCPLTIPISSPLYINDMPGKVSSSTAALRAAGRQAVLLNGVGRGCQKHN
jgi:hypothetical protein